VKSREEIMEILGSVRPDGVVQRCRRVGRLFASHRRGLRGPRDAGELPDDGPQRRERIIDPFLAEDRGVGRAVARQDPRRRRVRQAEGVGLLEGSERTVRRAVAEVKANYRRGRRRVYRPWIPEPGMWAQWDWGTGPTVGGRSTVLFCAWLAWSRFRVVIPCWDRTMPTLIGCVDRSMRAFGGAPTYWLTDNERTVTIDHVAGVR
jgi:hypothetical protein